jgi:hypothetical protein
MGVVLMLTALVVLALSVDNARRKLRLLRSLERTEQLLAAERYERYDAVRAQIMDGAP